jgi:hypothetical protein
MPNWTRRESLETSLKTGAVVATVSTALQGQKRRGGPTDTRAEH